MAIALLLADVNAGKIKAARIAIIAITTRSSISVNADRVFKKYVGLTVIICINF